MVYDQVGLAKLTHICWLGLRKHPIIVIHLRTPVALGAHWGGFVVPCVVQILVLGSWPRTFISIAWLLLLPFSRILSWNCQNPKVYYYGTKSFHRNYTILKGPLSPSPSKLWLIAGHSPPGWLMQLRKYGPINNHGTLIPQNHKACDHIRHAEKLLFWFCLCGKDTEHLVTPK